MLADIINFIQLRSDELIVKTLEHLFLTGVSTFFAIIIAVPLGVWLVRHPNAKLSVMGVVSILQTIPSFALLAFLLPFFGIGLVPALIALILYALLPIVRNTVTALENTPKHIIEASQALGFTPRQQLILVELPLALPVIVAGIRTAVVVGVGIATLATFIGAGGLGDFISRGLSTNNAGLIMLGAIPAALLATGLDFLIYSIEQWIKSKNRRRLSLPIRNLVVVTSFVLLVSGLVFISTPSEESRIITVASKNFTEQIILGEIMSQLIEAHTEYEVERKFNLGSAMICHRALLAGEIDIYPEYTGTALRVILDRKEQLSANETYQTVKNIYAEQFNLSWLKPFGFDDTYAIVTREKLAQEKAIYSISQLHGLGQELIFGASSEFYERPDGYNNFIHNYDLAFKQTVEMDLSLLYQALREEKVDIISGNSTDGRIPAYNLQKLEDDQYFFPPYFAAPVVRNTILKEYPALVSVLNRIAGHIDEQTMQQLNFQVDENKRSPYEVVNEFLSKRGLIN